jgi:hypothetical protein
VGIALLEFVAVAAAVVVTASGIAASQFNCFIPNTLAGFIMKMYKFFIFALFALSTLVLLTAAHAEPANVTVSYTAPTLNIDGTPITQPLTYNIYQWLNPGGLVEIQTGITVLSLKETSNVVWNNPACYVVTAVENGVESTPTNMVCFTPHKKKQHKHPAA